MQSIAYRLRDTERLPVANILLTSYTNLVRLCHRHTRSVDIIRNRKPNQANLGQIFLYLVSMLIHRNLLAEKTLQNGLEGTSKTEVVHMILLGHPFLPVSYLFILNLEGRKSFLNHLIVQLMIKDMIKVLMTEQTIVSNVVIKRSLGVHIQRNIPSNQITVTRLLASPKSSVVAF